VPHLVSISMDASRAPIGLFTTNRWISSMLTLFAPQIAWLLDSRYDMVRRWRPLGPDV
jgi:hypothetical protein